MIFVLVLRISCLRISFKESNNYTRTETGNSASILYLKDLNAFTSQLLAARISVPLKFCCIGSKYKEIKIKIITRPIHIW